MIHKDKKIEGYWYNKQHPEYPMPIPNVLSQEEAQRIFFLIKEKEKEAKELSYLGVSFSRITGEDVGCNEFQTDEWVWTGAFAEHYVLNHKVKPSEEFLKYIGHKKKPTTRSEYWIC